MRVNIPVHVMCLIFDCHRRIATCYVHDFYLPVLYDFLVNPEEKLGKGKLPVSLDKCFWRLNSNSYNLVNFLIMKETGFQSE